MPYNVWVTPFERFKGKKQEQMDTTRCWRAEIRKGEQLPLSTTGSRYSLLPYPEAQKAGRQTPAPQRPRNPPNPAGAPSLLEVTPVLGLGVLPKPWKHLYS